MTDVHTHDGIQQMPNISCDAITRGSQLIAKLNTIINTLNEIDKRLSTIECNTRSITTTPCTAQSTE